MGGVGGGMILIWHTIDGQLSGTAAADAYTAVVRPALASCYPGKTSFNILKDNDPTGNRSKCGMQAKSDNNLKVFEILKRSLAIWSEVEQRMCKQER